MNALLVEYRARVEPTTLSVAIWVVVRRYWICVCAHQETHTHKRAKMVTDEVARRRNTLWCYRQIAKADIRCNRKRRNSVLSLDTILGR